MDLHLSEEQEMLKTMARDFLTDKYPKSLIREMEEDEKGYSLELWKEMVDLGWLGLVLPEEFGGSGMSFLDLSVLLEEAGRACLPGPFFSTVVLGSLPVMEAGSDEQKQEYLPKIANGEAIFTLALTEASARYDADSVAVKATVDGDNYIINTRINVDLRKDLGKCGGPFIQPGCLKITGKPVPVRKDQISLNAMEPQKILQNLSFT